LVKEGFPPKLLKPCSKVRVSVKIFPIKWIKIAFCLKNRQANNHDNLLKSLRIIIFPSPISWNPDSSPTTPIGIPFPFPVTRHQLSITIVRRRGRIEGTIIIRRSRCPKNYWRSNENPKMVMSGVTMG